MELVKRNIHMDQVKGSASTQIALEDDINISDTKPDASQLICNKGSVVLEEIKVTQDHVNVKGKVEFSCVYQPEGEQMKPAGMDGTLNFEEQVYMEGIQSGDSVSASWDLEDLSIGLINSRKLSVQALIHLKLVSDMIYDEEAAVELYHEEPVEYRKKPLKIAQIAVKKRDIFRIREEISVPQNYPNIASLLWESTRIKDLEFRPAEERIIVQGEISAFFLYEGEAEEGQVRSFETTIPVNGVIDCHGCQDGMIEEICYTLGNQEIEIRTDFDGEQRIFALEMVLDLEINLYEEERLEILSGVYGVVKEVEAVSKPAQFKSLLARTAGKTKMADRLKLMEGNAPMIQLLHCEGQMQVDNEEITESGIRISGMLQIQALYLTGDSMTPYGSVKGGLAFEYTLEIPEIHEGCTYRLNVTVEQLVCAMLDSDEIDVKAVICCRAIVFVTHTEEIVTDIAVSDLDLNKLNELPGIVVYIAKEGDSLWDVGKKYYVPIHQIKETNDLAGDEIHPGDKLLIVKGTP